MDKISKIMTEHGLVIIYIIYFISDLTNSLYDEIENILFAFSCKLSYIILTLMLNLFWNLFNLLFKI